MAKQNTSLSIKTWAQLHIDDLNQQAWDLRVVNSNQAFTLSNDAVDLARQHHYQPGLAEGLRTLGFCHIRLARLSQALVVLRQALSLFEEQGHFHGQSDVYEYLGIIYRNQGDYTASLDSLFKSLQLRQELDYQEGIALSCYHTGITYKYFGDFENAVHYLLQGLPVAQKCGATMAESYLLNGLGSLYFEMNDSESALDYYNRSLTLRQRIGDQWGEAGCLDNIGIILLGQQKMDEALHFFQRGLVICKAIGDLKGQSNTLLHLGKIYQRMGQPTEALEYGKQSLAIRSAIGDKKGQAEISLFLGELNRCDQPAYALSLLHQALELSHAVHAKDLLHKTHRLLADMHRETDDLRSAFRHLELAHSLEKEIYTESVNKKLLNLQITHRVEQAQKEAEFYQLRTQELTALLEELRVTQAQLIQKEKMASLGELTAGIAHEIQNPLNFVNNFAEVCVEIADELKESLQSAEMDNAIQLSTDLQENMHFIVENGKRAASIVSSMLEHSRSNSGERRPTHLNELADEYLKLAYHSMRRSEGRSPDDPAQDPNFHVQLCTAFDDALPLVEVAPQEIGRVLLNLYNNAFYAVRQKQLQQGNGQGSVIYEPQVTVSTQRVSRGVEIRVRDNGVGIPEEIIGKIYQPFFTTRPAGHGTGLGLSLSYDIITKGYGGEIRVRSRTGEGTEFTISLPLVILK